ncbi:MAG TPA: hypothetical protein VLI06_17510 [Solimonas sp.]|nr:hypothetical protein [Solimonas sp.]
MTSPPALFSKLKQLWGVVEHLIVIGLIGLGSLLATTMVPDETALQYDIRTHQVNGLSVAHLQLSNLTNRAIDVELKPPEAGLVRFVTSIPGTATVTVQAPAWTGLLSPQQNMSLLLVIEGDLPEGLASKLVQGKFTVVEESTGAVAKRTADLREASVLSLSRSVRYGAWFISPFVLAGIAFILWVTFGTRTSKAAAQPQIEADKSKKNEKSSE